MNYKSVDVGTGKTVVICNRTFRTMITEGQYVRILTKADPIIAEYNEARLEIIAERERDNHDQIWLGQKIILLERQYAGVTTMESAIKMYCGIVARVTSTTNTDFDVLPSGFDTPNLVHGYQSFLDCNMDDPTDFWRILKTAVDEMDTPLTPVEIKPPEALTAAESADPLPASAG